MPITKRRMRRMGPLARRLARLHNLLHSVAEQARKLAGEIDEIEKKLGPYEEHLNRLRSKYLGE